MQMNASRPRMFKVLSPVEKQDGTTFWMRVGTGFPGKDSTSINLYLDAMPLNKKNMLHIREMDEEDLERAGTRRAQRRTAGAAGAEPLPATGSDDLPF